MGKSIDILFPIERGLKGIGICPFCIEPINEDDFRDELSIREYKISGLCQICMDKVFGINEK